MARCPECGGNVVGKNKRKICETCGLALTPTEYDREWRSIHSSKYSKDEDPEKKRKREYLDWYESKKD
ncbi:MAG: hypothetical protein ACTSRX_04670 [Promethearchaeota archaeon]